MSNYPSAYDDDTSIPRIDDNISDIGGDVVNDLRSATFAIETTLGLSPQGNMPSLAARLATSLDPSGAITPSSLAGLGLVYLPITNSEISPTAAISESKLSLTYPTATLYNLFVSLNNAIGILNGWLSTIGYQLEPHILGSAYNHELSAILVDDTLPMLKTNPQALVPSAGTNVISRNTTNADTLINDISNDLTVHEKADGSANVTAATGGTVPPQNFAHNSTGLYIDPDNFSTIPATIDTVQLFAEYVDQSSLLLLGSRVQTLYSNGIPRTARSQSLINDGYGGPLVPVTPVIAYLLGVPPGPISSTPVDDFVAGDDVILFQPTAGQLSTYAFDSQFALVQPGDIITINYGNGDGYAPTGISYQFAIDSIKAQISGSTRVYAVRINGKNLFSTSDGYARIDSSLFNREKYGVLAPAVAPNLAGDYESLIIANPRSAVALGNGFNPSEFDSSHYNLYLMMYPNGDPANTSTTIQMPAIDITGNQGATPGKYTLDSVVQVANTAFRQPGYNYRFIAFEYSGQFGIMLADPYNNASFSIVGGYGVNTSGEWTYGSGTSNATAQNCPNNAIDNGDPTHNPSNLIDPLGFGITAANIGSPPPAGITSFSYLSAISANIAPLLVFYPLSKNYFYANGAERDRLRSDPNYFFQNIDSFGDGYWSGSIANRIVMVNRVQVAYQINLDLATTGLTIGKTLVVQPAFPETDARYNARDYGRFIITNVQFYNCNTANAYTIITVYDGVHAVGASPTTTSPINTPVFIYFSDDSVSFDKENVFDANSSGYPYRRYFEIFVDQNGHTFSHERARFQGTGSGIDGIEFVNVSPKLRGYPGVVSEGATIRLVVSSFTVSTGVYIAQLGKWNGSVLSNLGPLTTGKQGEVVRVYDETNIDYIDFEFSYTTVSPTTGSIDIQLFPSLQLDEEFMCVSTCMVDDGTTSIALLEDKREFGNVSEEQLSSSALAYIAASNRELRENGIIQGFDLANNNPFTGSNATFSLFIGGVMTATGLTGITSGNTSAGEYITISNASVSANNGTFLILSVVSSGSITYTNINGNANDANSGAISWGIGPSYNVSITGGSVLVNGSIVNINNTSIEIPALWERLANGSTISSITWFLCASDSGELQLVASTDFDPNGSAASLYVTNNVNQDRLFSVINPSNIGAGHYTIRATYLSELVTNYKDITPLYVIEATTGPGIGDVGEIIVGYNISDIRRYISDGFNGLDALTLGPNSNFRSIQAIDTWLQQLTRYVSAVNHLDTIGTNVIVKGDWIINTSIYLDYVKPVIFTGDDAAFIFVANNSGSTPISGTILLGSNVTFNNINIINQFDPTASPSDSNYNTTVLSSNAEACIYVNVKSNINNAPNTNSSLTETVNLTITNCEFRCNNKNRFPFIVFNFADRGCVATNIVITDNTINTTYPTSDDLLSFVTFTMTAGSAVSTPLTGPFLINAVIDRNICNKNQAIIISAKPTIIADVTVHIYDLITTINCQITNNICGAIGCMTKDADLFSYQNASTYINNFTSDKNNGLLISNNTCKLIYSSCDDGAIGKFTNVFTFYCNAISSSQGLGASTIANNTVSWIHIGGPIQASCNAYNNTLQAYDYAFLSNYYSNISYASNAAFHIIYLLAPYTAPALNMILSNNSTSSTTSTSNNTSTITYNYFQCILADASVYIEGNILYGISNTTASGSGNIMNTGSTAFIILDGQSSSKIVNNTLIRSSTSITAYILNSSSSTQVVIDNTFDSPTIDGTNISLDAGTLAGSNYSRNINQTGSISISLMDYAKYIASGGTGDYSEGNGTNEVKGITPIFSHSNTGPAAIQIASYADLTVSDSPEFYNGSLFIQRVPSFFGFESSNYTWMMLYLIGQARFSPVINFSITLPLDYLLPNDTKIVAASIGSFFNNQGIGGLVQSSQEANQISLSLIKYASTTNNQVINGTSNTNTVLDVYKNITIGINPPNSPFALDGTVSTVDRFTTIIFDAGAPNPNPTYNVITIAQYTGGTQYCTVTPTYGTLVAGAGYKMSIEVDMNFEVNSSGAPVYFNWYLSPVVVQYRW